MDKEAENQNSINNIKVFFFIFSFLVFTTLPLIKIYNFKASYYDLGFYINYYKSLNNGNFELFFNFNFQLINLLIAKLLAIISIEKWYIVLIILQSLSLSSAHLFFKKKFNIHLVYFLFPTLWFTAFNNFHPDVFIIPLIFLLDKILHKPKINYYVLSVIFLIIISIKLSFILIVLGYFLYLIIIKKNNNKNFYLFLLFFTIYISIFLSLNEFEKMSLIKPIVLNIFENFKYSFLNKNFYLSLLIIFLSSGFCFGLNFKKLAPIIFLLILYFILPYDHLKNYYNHYYIPVFPFFILAAEKFLLTYNLKKKAIIYFAILHIGFSSSPLSVLFWSDYNWFYDKQTLLSYKKSSEVHNFIQTLNLNKNIIYIENNTLPLEIFSNQNTVKVVKSNSNFDDADYVFLRSEEPFFINDRGCGTSGKDNKCLDKSFLEKYNKIIINLKNKFEIVFNDNNNIKIYKKINYNN